MRLSSFEIKETGPLKLVQVSDLSNVVVFAGPNGVGKTNINASILNLARNPSPNDKTWMIVEATDNDEQSRWGRRTLDTRKPEEAETLRTFLRRHQRRNRYQGSFLNFDSDRAIRNVQNYGFSWDIGNPLAEDVGWDIGMQPLQSRYNDVRHSLFRLIESQRREMADKVEVAQNSGKKEMAIDFPDVIKPFKDVFWQLLAPKKLIEVNLRDQQIYYEHNGARLSLDTLSSGEKEVVNIVFDFLLRSPQQCVVLFDEPELHLHPELSYKLLQTLSGIGLDNQFIFSTHSPEIISASLENTVVFVTPPRGSSENQAIVVHRDDETHHALQALGQSIGVISLGKKLVLIEGNESSLDKLTYGAILQSSFPEFVLVPVGGKDVIRSFDEVKDSILDKTIWGVDFFMLCDRDAINSLGKSALSETTLKSVKQLPKYHLENYFLDEEVLVRIFAQMEAEDSWLRDSAAVRSRIRQIAVTVVPYATALNVAATIREKVGNISIMPKGASSAQSAQELASLILQRVRSEGERVSIGLNVNEINLMVLEEHARLTKAVETDDPMWRSDLPGRIILNKFAGITGMQVGRLKQLYLANSDKVEVFADIFSIFRSFRDGR